METTKTEVMSLRVPTGTVLKIRKLAHEASLQRGREITWYSLVREAIEKQLTLT